MIRNCTSIAALPTIMISRTGHLGTAKTAGLPYMSPDASARARNGIVA
jgi:hypothetical protein